MSRAPGRAGALSQRAEGAEQGGGTGGQESAGKERRKAGCGVRKRREPLSRQLRNWGSAPRWRVGQQRKRGTAEERERGSIKVRGRENQGVEGVAAAGRRGRVHGGRRDPRGGELWGGGEEARRRRDPLGKRPPQKSTRGGKGRLGAEGTRGGGGVPTDGTRGEGTGGEREGPAQRGPGGGGRIRAEGRGEGRPVLRGQRGGENEGRGGGNPAGGGSARRGTGKKGEEREGPR